jgi:hypothetical protein
MMTESMPGPGVAASSRIGIEDILVGLCGLATSLLVAVILWWIEDRFSFAFYSWTFWFVIPAGALFSGFAGASGYHAGAWIFGRRPTRLLLFNIIVASVATYFLIHYLSYVTMVVDGTRVRDYISFSKFLQLVITTTSMTFRSPGTTIGDTGELGNFGYAIAGLQVIGFAVGGFSVYVFLKAKPYCERCLCYLAKKGKQTRFAESAEKLAEATTKFRATVASGDIPSAVQAHKESAEFGKPKFFKGCRLRSLIEVRQCKKCSKNWMKYKVEGLAGNNWKEEKSFTVERFTDQNIVM